MAMQLPNMTMGQGFFSQPAHMADINRPFMLSMDTSTAEDPRSASEFAAMLVDLLREDVEEEQRQLGVGAAAGVSGDAVAVGSSMTGSSYPVPALGVSLASGMQPPPYTLSASQPQAAPQPFLVASLQHQGPQSSVDNSVSATSSGVLGQTGGSGLLHSDSGDVGAQEHSRRQSSGTGCTRGKVLDKVSRRAAVQKRYREKKEGALHQLQQEASEKAAALAALEQEHTVLLTRQSTLEKLVQCRDEQLMVLARARGLCRNDLHQVLGDSAVPLVTGVPSSAGGCCFGTQDCSTSIAVTLSEEDIAMYKNMTVPELINKWKGFVTSASLLLSQLASKHGSQAAEEQLKQLVSDNGVMMRGTIQLNCAALYALFQMNLDTGALAQPADSHWAQVLKTIALSPSQQLEATTMFDLYVELMSKVHEERRMLKTGLAAMATQPPTQSVPDYLLPPGPCCVDEMTYAEQLLLSLHKERSTRCLLCCFFFGKLLTPSQLAQAAVASHPFFPDPLALSRVLAQSRTQQA